MNQWNGKCMSIKFQLWNWNYEVTTLINWIKANWMKVDRGSLRLLIPCAIFCYDALIDFIGQYLKRGRYKYKEWGWKKNDTNLYLEIFSFIVDIRPGSEYHSDERNKLFGFSKKANLKATILGIRMCSTELLLWKNRKARLVTP